MNQKPKPLAVIDGETLMDKRLPKRSFCIETLLPEGISMLGGAPKIGKSWMVLDIGVRIAKGESIWSLPTKRGTVLYLALEDSLARIQERLCKLTDDVPGNLFFAIAAGTLADDLCFQIEQFISEHRDTVLVISDEMKTEGSRRTLPLIPDVEEILLRHKKKQEGYQRQFRRGYSVKYLDMVCMDQMGNLLKPNYVTTRFPEVLKKYGLRPIRFHDLRHTCASLLVAKNINMKIIQVWLGHSNMSTTADIYSHLDANAKSEAGRAIESVLSINTESED